MRYLARLYGGYYVTPARILSENKNHGELFGSVPAAKRGIAEWYAKRQPPNWAGPIRKEVLEVETKTVVKVTPSKIVSVKFSELS